MSKHHQFTLNLSLSEFPYWLHYFHPEIVARDPNYLISGRVRTSCACCGQTLAVPFSANFSPTVHCFCEDSCRVNATYHSKFIDRIQKIVEDPILSMALHTLFLDGRIMIPRYSNFEIMVSHNGEIQAARQNVNRYDVFRHTIWPDKSVKTLPLPRKLRSFFPPRDCCYTVASDVLSRICPTWNAVKREVNAGRFWMRGYIENMTTQTGSGWYTVKLDFVTEDDLDRMKEYGLLCRLTGFRSTDSSFDIMTDPDYRILLPVRPQMPHTLDPRSITF